MSDDRLLREEIRRPLDGARNRIRRYTGLYPDENLAREVLHMCDAVMARVDATPRLREMRETVRARCQWLAQVTDRFAERDLASISKARAQAVAAVDMLQDAVLDWRRIEEAPQASGVLLRRRSR
jgi:hypothetical protein